jgi:hypothetical protein
VFPAGSGVEAYHNSPDMSNFWPFALDFPEPCLKIPSIGRVLCHPLISALDALHLEESCRPQNFVVQTFRFEESLIRRIFDLL